jgi:hypothetical protein
MKGPFVTLVSFQPQVHEEQLVTWWILQLEVVNLLKVVELVFMDFV